MRANGISANPILIVDWQQKFETAGAFDAAVMLLEELDKANSFEERQCLVARALYAWASLTALEVEYELERIAQRDAS
jgi:hypothetical protein